MLVRRIFSRSIFALTLELVPRRGRIADGQRLGVVLLDITHVRHTDERSVNPVLGVKTVPEAKAAVV